MTSLNPRLRLALLNRKKSRKLLDKGFTLVELMIVIVIVGILSAVALPNFLSQTDKAKLTEAKTQAKAYLTNYHIATLDGTTSTAVLSVNSGGACPVDTANWTFTCAQNTGEITVGSAGTNTAAGFVATVDNVGVISGI